MDIEDLESYREGNRLEVKRALGRDGKGELPRSVWETLSAFANTAGGTIVLGASERKDGSLEVHGIPMAERVLDDFWNAALSKDKVSARFMKDGDASVESIDGKDVVVIRVPWANRYIRPVFINDDLFGGTFRRTHTGDHLCEREEILSMLRDSDTDSQDAAVAEASSVEHIDWETVARYRRRFNERNEKHVWAELDDEGFLRNIGALREDDEGVLKPTRAGLLMFGEDRFITYEFPHYFLDYRQETSGETRWDDRFTSQTGDWSGNVYDFYGRAYNKLKAALKVPFRLEGVDRVDDTPAHEALREAIVNALTNANWFDRRGVVCVWGSEGIAVANPGDFRMPIEVAREAGRTDPRNEAIMKMFALVEIGERAGSGMDKIFDGWAWAGHPEPAYAVEYGPDRTVLTLPLGARDAGRIAAAGTLAHSSEGLSENERLVIEAVERMGRIATGATAELTGLSRQGAADLLRRLESRGMLVWHGKSVHDPRQHYTAK